MNQNIFSNSIFFETHQENIDLRIDLNNFIDNYQTNETIEEDEIYQFDGEDYEDYDEVVLCVKIILKKFKIIKSY